MISKAGVDSVVVVVVVWVKAVVSKAGVDSLWVKAVVSKAGVVSVAVWVKAPKSTCWAEVASPWVKAVASKAGVDSVAVAVPVKELRSILALVLRSLAWNSLVVASWLPKGNLYLLE